MDLSMLDWVVVIVLLLLLVVGLDGYRRAQRERRNRVRISKNAKRNFEIEDEQDFPSELPNGGARKVETREVETIDPTNPPEIASERIAFQKPVAEKPLRAETPQTHNDGDELDPLFVDPIEYAKTKQQEAQQLAQNYMAQNPQPEAEAAEPKLDKQGEPKKPEAKIAEAKAEPNKASELAQKAKDWANNKMASKETPASNEQPETSPANSEPDDIIILHVLAKDKEGFIGRDLVHILTACDCQFGDMNIFHRYEEKGAEGEIQFSIVNRLKPGTFDLDAIDDFQTPGISFFLRLPGPKDPIEAFTCMEATAKTVAKTLGGTVKDEQLSTVTEQTLEHCRERITLHKKQQLIKSQWSKQQHSTGKF